MDELVKVYEEESMEIRKVWLNEILEEKAIPYKNDVKRRNASQIVGELQPFQLEYTIEVYVHEGDVPYVKELIKEYENAEFAKTDLELNDDYIADDLQEQDSKFMGENANEYKEDKDCENDNKKGGGPIIFNL